MLWWCWLGVQHVKCQQFSKVHSFRPGLIWSKVEKLTNNQKLQLVVSSVFNEQCCVLYSPSEMQCRLQFTAQLIHDVHIPSIHRCLLPCDWCLAMYLIWLHVVPLIWCVGSCPQFLSSSRIQCRTCFVLLKYSVYYTWPNQQSCFLGCGFLRSLEVGCAQRVWRLRPPAEYSGRSPEANPDI